METRFGRHILRPHGKRLFFIRDGALAQRLSESRRASHAVRGRGFADLLVQRSIARCSGSIAPLRNQFSFFGDQCTVRHLPLRLDRHYCRRQSCAGSDVGLWVKLGVGRPQSRQSISRASAMVHPRRLLPLSAALQRIGCGLGSQGWSLHRGTSLGTRHSR